ncbi:MAG: hypothetical protein Q8Q20_00800 [bacterium]|nr:hypothetical protein [bacterium]
MNEFFPSTTPYSFHIGYLITFGLGLTLLSLFGVEFVSLSWGQLGITFYIFLGIGFLLVGSTMLWYTTQRNKMRLHFGWAITGALLALAMIAYSIPMSKYLLSIGWHER